MIPDFVYPIILAALGAIIGATFADIDLAPPLPVKHRSAWTHGPLVPWALIYLNGQYPHLWWFTAGFLPAFVFHLVADMFPRRWHGSARINLFPIPLALPALLSFLFLAATAAYAGWVVAGMFGIDWLG